MPARLPVRTRWAVRAGAAGAALSRATGLGRGGIIGGRVSLALDGRALQRLAAGRRVVLVTGTNGKTTTTLMVCRALSALPGDRRVASNHGGANMPDGLVAALSRDLAAPVAVLEVDESYLAGVVAAVAPDLVLLLNLSRDQLDRVGEVHTLELSMRAALAASPRTTVVANADDVLVTSAAAGAGRVAWVAAGAGWTSDTASCPRCGAAVLRAGEHWQCRCGLHRPEPAWWLAGDQLRHRADSWSMDLRLPGRVNRSNAAMAVVAAAQLGVPVECGLAALSGLDEVDGRYERVPYAAHEVRLLLAKNPAGWQETLALLDPAAAVVVSVNGRQADGEDMSWLWDVPFELLRGRFVVAAGERCADLAARLDYGRVAHRLRPDPLHAVATCPPGPVELVANYSAFRVLRGRLRRAG